MKILNKFLVSILVIVFMAGFSIPTAVFAATTPSLGSAATFGVLGGTYSNSSAATTINGDVGYVTAPATPPIISGATHVNDGAYTSAKTDTSNTLSTGLATQPCTPAFTFGATTDLSTLPQPLTPGVYCIAGAASIGTGGITLTGSGTYIFRITGALTSADNSHVTLSAGVSACDVFWTPTAATTLGANTTFAGTVIDNANAITVGANTTWTGRALSLGAGTVTTGNTDTIGAPTCSVPPATATLTVVKVVVGGPKVVSDFPLFVDGLNVTSGLANSVSVGQHTVSENTTSNYAAGVITGDCDATGHVTVGAGDAKVCTITNTYVAPSVGGGGPANVVNTPIAPIISVVKVPSPLALPAGPGSVTYTYTLKNIGIVPATNITMVDDSCSAMHFVSGDSNANSILDVNETWTYTCATTLSATHTNTVVATGYANGISATDTATATVVVGVSTVPPLIHVTKMPSALFLQAGGGMDIYTEQITNPGTAALSNVTIGDDKCSPVGYVSGDVNSNGKLDAGETWKYTCQANITQTTTNTVRVSGDANGMTARDFAVATVVVAPVIPALPNTGFAPKGGNNVLGMTIFGIALMVVLTSVFVILKKREN